MATDLRTLKPSQTRKIAMQLEAGQGVGEFLIAVRNFLAHSSDVGHSGDALLATARELSAAGVWPHVRAKDLSEAISGAEPTVRLRFLAGLPAERRAAVERQSTRLALHAGIYKTPYIRSSETYAVSKDCVRFSFPAGSANQHMASAQKLNYLNVDVDHFCDFYNQKTSHIRKGTPTTVVVSRTRDVLSYSIQCLNVSDSSRWKASSDQKKSFATRGTVRIRPSKADPNQ